MIDFPIVTIIMPIRNEADFIERSLGAVLSQDYPHDRMQVLIADGMSDDDTRDHINHLAEKSLIEITILDNPRRIVPTGMNIALQRATGDIIVRVDGHTIIAPDYVLQCVKALQQSDADNVGGRMDAVGTTPLAKTIALATSSPFGVGGARFHYSAQKEWVDTVYMGAWWHTVFERIGKFDEEMVRNQDDEFNYRLQSQGGKILLDPNIKSKYYNRSTLKTLIRQYYQYGFYKVRVLQKHPLQMRPRQFVPPIFVFLLLIGSVLSLCGRLFLMIWLGLMFSYIIANLTASWITMYNSENKQLWRLPGIFASLHLSYGLGFLHGLLAFWSRWREN
jgi:succinoglycan biosynthesis protein ExoA